MVVVLDVCSGLLVLDSLVVDQEQAGGCWRFLYACWMFVFVVVSLTEAEGIVEIAMRPEDIHRQIKSQAVSIVLVDRGQSSVLCEMGRSIVLRETMKGVK